MQLFKKMEIDPCIPSDWNEFEVIRKWRGATYQIKVSNPENVQKGIKSVKLNGEEINDLIPVQEKGTINIVEVTMGSSS